MEDKLQNIIFVLQDMDDDDLICLWNERCDECNCMDDRIYNMCEFNDICGGWLLPSIDNNPLEIIERVKIDFDDFDSGDDYFYIDGYGHYVSFHSLAFADGAPFNYDELAEAIMDGKVDVTHYDELNEIVNGDEDDEEEEE